MIVKVCGMRDADNIRALESEVRPDFMGFIFYPKSKRYVAEVPSYLPRDCHRVGVFVNAEMNDILDRVCDYDLTALQLHGDESPAWIAALRKRLDPDILIIKAMPFRPDGWQPYEAVVDLFLFDTPTPGYGGAGTSFDWSLLASYTGEKPFLLSGGIGPDSIERLKTFRHPRWVGIDLNSRFELAPALKDVAKVKDFVKGVKEKEERRKE